MDALNSKTNKLQEEIRLSSKNAFATIREIQRSLYALDSETNEEEIKLLTNYTKIHHNSFSRHLDMCLQWDDKSWLEDFKTSITYLEKYLLSIWSTSGATLPIRYRVDIPIINAEIVGEKTDVGDTITPVVSTSPRNIFLKNKIFKHVIFRKGFDTTSRKYKEKTSYDTYPYSAVATMTLQTELPNLSRINFLEIVPAGASVLDIKQISYINEAGEEIEILASSISNQITTTLLFEPIYTKYLIVQFEQTAAAARTSSSVSDSRTDAMNKIIDSTGFSVMFEGEKKNISGRYYDFSISSCSMGIIEYEPKGIFRSLPIKVKNPLGMDIDTYVEMITPERTFDDYYEAVILPEGDTLSESYVGVHLKDLEDNVRVDGIVPIPDNYPYQTEYLSPQGDICRVKLFPDMMWNSPKTKVDNLLLGLYCMPLPVDEEEGDFWDEEGWESDPDYDPYEGCEEDEEGPLEDPEETPGDSSTSSTASTEAADGAYDTSDIDDEDTSGGSVDEGADDGDTEGEDSCLLAGQLIVVSETGEALPVEELEIGQEVYTYDSDLDVYDYYEISDIIESDTIGYLEIWVDGSDSPLICSKGHHLINELFDEVDARDVSEGDYLWMYNFSEEEPDIFLKRIERINYYSDEVSVYNVTVKDAHTYITSNGILQHNKVYSDDSPGWVDGTAPTVGGMDPGASEVLTTTSGSGWDPEYETSPTSHSYSKGVWRPSLRTVGVSRVTLKVNAATSRNWSKKFTQDKANRLRNRRVKGGEVSATEETMKKLLGNIWSDRSQCSKKAILKDPFLLSSELTLDKKLMSGSDGTSFAYSKYVPKYLKPLQDLPPIQQDYHSNGLVGVTFAERINDTSAAQIFDVELHSVDNYNLRNSKLNHLNSVDKITVGRSLKIRQAAGRMLKLIEEAKIVSKKKGYPNWIQGFHEIGKSRANRNIINEYYSTKLNCLIGYRLNSDGHIEMVRHDGTYTNVFMTPGGALNQKRRLKKAENIVVDYLKNGGKLKQIDESFKNKIAKALLPRRSNEVYNNEYGNSNLRINFPYENGDSSKYWKDTPVDGMRASGLPMSEDLSNYSFNLSLDRDILSKVSSGKGTVSNSGKTRRAKVKSINSTWFAEFFEMNWDEIESTLIDIDFDNLEIQLTSGETTTRTFRGGAGGMSPEDHISIDAEFHPCGDGFEGIEAVVFELETESHGYTAGDLIALNAATSTEISKDYEIMAVEGARIYIAASEFTEEALSLISSGIPSSYRVSIINLSEADDPLEVWEDNRLLTLGVDYVISLDSKSTWYTYWPRGSHNSHFWDKAKAGRFYIKFLEGKRNQSSVYWTKYRVYRNQSLSKDDLIFLRNGRVSFDKKLKQTGGTMQSVILFRSNTSNPYVTPVLKNYTLKIQEALELKSPNDGRLKKGIKASSSWGQTNVS